MIIQVFQFNYNKIVVRIANRRVGSHDSTITAHFVLNRWLPRHCMRSASSTCGIAAIGGIARSYRAFRSQLEGEEGQPDQFGLAIYFYLFIDLQKTKNLIFLHLRRNKNRAQRSSNSQTECCDLSDADCNWWFLCRHLLPLWAAVAEGADAS